MGVPELKDSSFPLTLPLLLSVSTPASGSAVVTLLCVLFTIAIDYLAESVAGSKVLGVMSLILRIPLTVWV